MKTPSLRFCAVLALALALAGAGCATVNTVSPANPGTTPDLVADKRVITDSSLNDIAYVVEVDKGVVSGNLARVQVELHNTTSAVKNFSYKFEWFDAQNLAITSPAPVPKPATIEGGGFLDIGDTATSPNAVTWRLQLMESVRTSPRAF